MMQRSRGRDWQWSRASSRFWHRACRSRRPCSDRDAVGRGEGPHAWGFVGYLAGANSFVCLFDMAGWRCPEGDASSRWLIDIRTDLFPPPTMIAETRAGRANDPLAELARLIGQTDPFGGRAKQAPHPVQSRQRSVNITSRRNLLPTTSTAAGPPPWMRPRATPPRRQLRSLCRRKITNRITVPSAVHPLHRYAAPLAAFPPPPAGAGLSPGPVFSTPTLRSGARSVAL